MKPIRVFAWTLPVLALMVLAAVAFFFRGRLAGAIPVSASKQNLADISLPAGFEIAVYADNIPGARSMTLSPRGTLFVGTRDEGKVYAVINTNDDTTADRVITLVSGGNLPNGVAFRDGTLFVAEVNRIYKFPGIEQSLDKLPARVMVTTDYPSDRHHGWKFIAFGPDGKLYVPVGAPCNICEPDEIHASITRINPDGTGREIFARGVRNTVGFDWHPQTKELWFTENGRDRMGDDVPPDELNHAPQSGMHFGFPYCHGKSIPDPEFGRGKDCSRYTQPALELGPHVAAIGMRFYTGTNFPERYRGGIFIAEHGSWNRSRPIGYRVMFVPIKDNRAMAYEVFAEGWLSGSSAWGRPADVLVMPDGALLVSDDRAGKIYRITYRKQGS